MLTPIAVFAYSRPRHLERCLSALARCAERTECAVTIFCDGPRPGDDPAAIESVRAVARDWTQRHGGTVREAPANRGLARSIVDGVSELCAAHGRVIVVEDDLEVAPDFLRYMRAALDRYAAEPAVMQISGSRLPFAWAGENDALFLPCTTTWGWATWERAWQHFRWTPPDLTALDDPAVSRAFDLDGAYPYAQMLRDRVAGQNDSWGILWWWAVFRARGLVLYPRESLVSVGGFDGSGTHCEDSPDFLGAQASGVWPGADARFPTETKADARALAALQRWLRARREPWWRRTWRALVAA